MEVVVFVASKKEQHENLLVGWSQWVAGCLESCEGGNWIW